MAYRPTPRPDESTEDFILRATTTLSSASAAKRYNFLAALGWIRSLPTTTTEANN